MKRNSIRHRLLASTMVGGATLFAMTAVSAATLLAPTAVMAQSQGGTLRINVVGSNGEPLSGATVTVSSPSSLITRTATTDAEGRARLSGLDPATDYTVAIAASGYDAYNAENVAVISGRELALGYALGAATVDDIVVTGRSLAAVDVTSATVGTTLTLATVEALPTGRSYQSYLQLVPGVKPSNGNPSSRSGNNYSDTLGAIGTSTDNLYYLDGVDVTDPVTGTFGANFNSEIIQEQQVLVGGVPAEYAGGSGLISRVVTKSGSNEWHGSLNYYFQNDGLVAEDEHNTSGGFSTYDTAFTLGGPILQDRLWFFASYQKLFREDEVLNTTTGDVVRTVERNDENAFLKLTWQATSNDRFVASYFSDPATLSGSSLASTLNRRDYSREQGGDNYKIEYNRTWGDLLVNAYFFKHESQLTDVAVDQTVRDNVTYLRADGATLEQRQLGGRGINFDELRGREEYGVNAEYFLDTSFGSHTFKAGLLSTQNSYFQTDSVPGGVTYASLDDQYSGTTLIEATADVWTALPINSGDYTNFLLPSLNENARAIAALDTNADGEISSSELDALVFDNTTGNPYGNVNTYRSLRTADGPYEVSSEGQTFYLQDTWTMDQLTVNAGLRAEKWEHFASDGSKLVSFDWEIAPRLSVVYDILGDGRSKVFGFVGRYYDPIRNDMTDFAGAKTGPVNEEQIFIDDAAGGQWVTFRVRGPGDAAIAPSIKTPYTDEFMIGASTTFGSSIGLSASLTRRVTKDIMEDYDLSLYSDPDGDTTNGAANADSPFYLPLSYFGYTENPGTNYVLGTLAGGKREYTGFEVVLTKFKTDNWFGQVSYTFNHAKGNSNSDGNADFQGDWLALDPRAPNIWGDQAGNIPHQFKAYASYEFDFGLEVAGVFNWNSGSLYTPGNSTSNRYLPTMYSATRECGVDDPSTPQDDRTRGYYFGGVCDRWVLPGQVGSEQNPSYYTFDMRLKYVLDLPFGETEFFLDAFNILNNQAATSVMANRAGSGQYDYQEANNWVAPRRLYVGARYSF